MNTAETSGAGGGMRNERENLSQEVSPAARADLVETGLAVAEMSLRDQVKTWEHYTDEKADVAHDLMRGVKELLRETPDGHAFRTLSIGSSEEPQFKLLQALSDGGLWLFDKDPEALGALNEIIARHMLTNTHLAHGDYVEDFRTDASTDATLSAKLGGAPFDLVTLHHALYYCDPQDWPGLVARLSAQVLRAPGMLHLALMSASTDRPHTTTWLYNRFARKFCGVVNSQNLLDLPAQIRGLTDGLNFVARSSATRFRPNDFGEMMAVVWMILLYPHVHSFDVAQRTEITEFVLDEFWLPGRNLVQIQDYVTATKRS